VICRCSPFAMPDNVGVNRQLNRQQARIGFKEKLTS
jgi:hypothetical protein